MKDLVIAGRNILRHARRTVVTVSALVIGLAGMVVFQGFLGEMMKGFRDGMILAGAGHLQVAARERYFIDGEFNPFAYGLADAGAIAQSIAKQPGVSAVFPSTGFVAVADLGDQSATLLVKAYPPERMYFAPAAGIVAPPRDRFNLGTMRSGRQLAPTDRDRLMLGETAARLLGAKAGDVVTLMAILPGGNLEGRDFTVSGIYSAPGQDKTFAYTDYATGSDFIRMSTPPVLVVIAKNIESVPAIERSLPPGVAYRGWKDLVQLFVQVNSILQSFLTVIRAIILLVTLFILANSMSRMVRERMREWGTLRALGTKKRDILALVLYEGGLLGLLGAAVGITLGFAISEVIDIAGGLAYRNGSQVYTIMVRPGFDTLWQNLIPAAFTAGLAALLPGLRAIRPTPAESLREA